MKIITNIITPETVRSSLIHLKELIENEGKKVITGKNFALIDEKYMKGDSLYRRMRPAFFTNENNSFVYAKKMPGKAALVIAGSGDLIIDLIVNGYQRVVGIDINILQLFVTIVKLKSIEKLDFTEFRNFWDASCDCFRFETLKKVLADEDEVCTLTLEFWQKVFEFFEYDNQKVRYNAIFGESMFIDHDSMRTTVPEYAKKSKTYKRYRHIVQEQGEVELECADINEYQPAENVRFELIHFTNLYNFMTPEEYLTMVKKYKNYLSLKGKIITYIIQLDEDWITKEDLKIKYSQIKSIPILDNGKIVNYYVDDMTSIAVEKQCMQARAVYRGLIRLGNVTIIRVDTGKGFSSYYNTIKDLVVISSF